MKRLPGVILFLILALVIMQIVTLRMLSSTQKRLAALENKVATISVTQPAPAKPAP
ncbi:MAG: hypothetical protein QM790_18205 [Nibricoccus sp.]